MHPEDSMEQASVKELTVIETIASEEYGIDLLNVIATRADTFAAMQNSYDSLLHPNEPGELSLAERSFVAYHVALSVPQPALAALYRSELLCAEADTNESPSLLDTPESNLSSRLQVMLRYVRLSASIPMQASERDVESLAFAGLGSREIISLSQLIAFVSYQARVLCGLRLWEGGN
jgi:uncharacterized protein YciW